MAQDTASSLQHDAFSLAPDADEVTKAVLDKNLFAANMRPVADKISGDLTGYMQEFQKDPYYAFTREGRATTKRIKDMLNHPELKAMEENTKAAQEEYKRATAERINKNYVVEGSAVLAIKDGRRQFIPLDDIKALDSSKGDKVLNVDSDYYATKNIFGVDSQPRTYNMTALDKVDDKIHTAFAGLGSTSNAGQSADPNDPTVDKTFKVKDNRAQLTAAVSMLARTGLNEADKNTLRSEYIREAGADVSNRGFSDWLVKRLTGIAETKITTETENGEKAAVGARRLAGGAAGKPVPVGPAELTFLKDYGTRTVTSVDPKGNAVNQEAYQLPKDVLDKSTGEQKDDYGNIIPNRTLSALKVISTAGSLQDLTVINRNTGLPMKMPSLGKNAVVSDDPSQRPGVVYNYTYNDNGRPTIIPPEIIPVLERIIQTPNQPIPQQYHKYLTQKPDGSLSLKQAPWFDMTVLSAAPRGWYDGRGAHPDRDALDDIGYKSVENPEAADYYNQHSGKANSLGHGLLGVNDEVHEVRVQIPVTSMGALRQGFGDRSYGKPEDVSADNVGEFYDNGLSISPDRLDNTKIVNQFTGNPFPKLSSMK